MNPEKKGENWLFLLSEWRGGGIKIWPLHCSIYVCTRRGSYAPKLIGYGKKEGLLLVSKAGWYLHGSVNFSFHDFYMCFDKISYSILFKDW